MNINKTILRLALEHLDVYDCPKKKIEEFINLGEGSDRAGSAIELVEDIMKPHQKQSLYENITELYRIEQGTLYLKETGRDHVLHAIMCFLLGIVINERFIKKVCVSDDNKVSEFQWKLSALFHDVGYPIEIVSKVLSNFNENIKRISEQLGIKEFDSKFFIQKRSLDKLSNGKDILDLLQTRIDSWELQVNVKRIYHSLNSDSKVCHGIISSLILLKTLGELYIEKNPGGKEDGNFNQKHFNDDIVSACAAIFVHNLKQNDLNGTKINLCKAPLAFLLKISDCLQDWERPGKDNEHGMPAEDYDISIENKEFKISIANDESRTKILKEIQECVEISCTENGKSIVIKYP